MPKFRRRVPSFTAVQISDNNIDRIMAHVADVVGNAKKTFIGSDGIPTDLESPNVGLLIERPSGVEFAIIGDWVVRNDSKTGDVYIIPDSEFQDQFESLPQ